MISKALIIKRIGFFVQCFQWPLRQEDQVFAHAQGCQGRIFSSMSRRGNPCGRLENSTLHVQQSPAWLSPAQKVKDVLSPEFYIGVLGLAMCLVGLRWRLRAVATRRPTR